MSSRASPSLWITSAVTPFASGLIAWSMAASASFSLSPARGNAGGMSARMLEARSGLISLSTSFRMAAVSPARSAFAPSGVSLW